MADIQELTVQNAEQENDPTGILSGQLHGEQVENHGEHQRQIIFGDRFVFLEIPAPQDAGIAFGEEDDADVEEEDERADSLVDGIIIRIGASEADPVRQDQGQLHQGGVKYDEVQMLHPAAPYFLIHVASHPPVFLLSVD